MAEAIGQALPLAIGVALSPVPIIAVVLMLGTPRARGNGPAFIVGWMVGLAVVGTVVLLASAGANASRNGKPAAWVDWVKLVLGVSVLLLALRQWRSRPHAGAPADVPKWMQTIDAFKPPKAAGFGALLSALNPKNLLLTVAAAAAIAQTGASTASQAVALVVFVAVATLGVGAPVALYFALGERSRRTLDELNAWMSAHNAAIMTVLCLIIGAKLVGDAITGFAA